MNDFLSQDALWGLHDNHWGVVRKGSDGKWYRTDHTPRTMVEAERSANNLQRYHENAFQYGVVNAVGHVIPMQQSYR